MHLTEAQKKAAFSKFGGSEKNTGSTEAQVALLTERINHISGHLGRNKKDFSTLRSLDKMVSRRKKLLNYLQRKDIGRYREIIKELDLRK